MSRAKDVTHKHSLKVAARAVMAAQRFSETPHETDDGATMTSNMHRSETTVPFNALIHFLTFSTELELSKPWQMKKPMVSTGTGFYIGNRRILTNSHVIRNATSLRVERHGQPGNFPARVLCEGVMCDLAIVTVDSDDFFTGLPAVRLQEEVPELDDTVICLGYPLGATSITVTRGVVSNVHMKDLSLRGWNDENLLLVVQIDAAINPGNSGGPVFSYQTAAVVGVAFAGRIDVQGMSFIIPVPVIKLFLEAFERSKQPHFAPLPMLGIATQDLINPSLRRMCFGGATPPTRDGILISEAVQGGCAQLAGVRSGDVLVAIDGVPISEKGDVPFRGHERLDWVYLITKKPTGSRVKLSVLRRPPAQPGAPGAHAAVGPGQGSLERAVIEVVLAPLSCLLPTLLSVDYHPGWVIIGGLVFLRTGQPLLDQIVNKRATGSFTHVQSLMSLFDKDGVASGVEEVVILQDVLAHDINVSYEDYAGLLLHSINGTRITSLAQLARFYASCVEPFLTLEFNGSGRKEKHAEQVVLELALCELTQLEILAQHKMPNWCSDDVIPPQASRASPSGSSLALLADPMALRTALAGGAPIELVPAARDKTDATSAHDPRPAVPPRAHAPTAGPKVVAAAAAPTAAPLPKTSPKPSAPPSAPASRPISTAESATPAPSPVSTPRAPPSSRPPPARKTTPKGLPPDLPPKSASAAAQDAKPAPQQGALSSFRSFFGGGDADKQK